MLANLAYWCMFGWLAPGWMPARKVATISSRKGSVAISSARLANQIEDWDGFAGRGRWLVGRWNSVDAAWLTPSKMRHSFDRMAQDVQGPVIYAVRSAEVISSKLVIFLLPT